jgi:hypothetical protein
VKKFIFRTSFSRRFLIFGLNGPTGCEYLCPTVTRFVQFGFPARSDAEAALRPWSVRFPFARAFVMTFQRFRGFQNGTSSGI